jgi:hypothetical protein
MADYSDEYKAYVAERKHAEQKARFLALLERWVSARPPLSVGLLTTLFRAVDRCGEAGREAVFQFLVLAELKAISDKLNAALH